MPQSTNNNTNYTIVDEHIAVIVLARESTPIAKTRLMEIKQAVSDIVADDRIVAAVLLGGEGTRMFCPGYSLNDTHVEVGVDYELDPLYALTAAIEGCPKPFIATINGATSDIGLAIALACHYRVAVEGYTLVTSSSTALGLTPIGGITVRLPRCVGLKIAFNMLCLGAAQDASECKSIGLVSHIINKEVSTEKYALAASKAVESQAVAARIAGKLPILSKRTSHLQLSPIVNFQSNSLKSILQSRDPVTASSHARPNEVPPSVQTLALLTQAIISDPAPLGLVTGTALPLKRLFAIEASTLNKVLHKGGIAYNLHHMHSAIKCNVGQHAAPKGTRYRMSSTATAVFANFDDPSTIEGAFEICSQLLLRSPCPEIALVIVGGPVSNDADILSALPPSTQARIGATEFKIHHFPPSTIQHPIGLIFSPTSTLDAAAKQTVASSAILVELAGGGATLPDPRAAAAVFGSFASKSSSPLRGLPVVEVAFTQPTHTPEVSNAIRMVLGAAPIINVTLVGGSSSSSSGGGLTPPADTPISRLLRFGAAAGVGPISAQLLLRTFASAMALAWEGALPKDVDIVMRRYGCKIGPFALMDKVGLANVLEAVDGGGGIVSKYDIWSPLRELINEANRNNNNKDDSKGKTTRPATWYSYTQQQQQHTTFEVSSVLKPARPPLVAMPPADQPPGYIWGPERTLVNVAYKAGIRRRFHLPLEVKERILFPLINEATLVLAKGESTPLLYTSTLFPTTSTSTPASPAYAHPRQHFTVSSEWDVDILSVLGGGCCGFPAHLGGLMYWAVNVLKDGRGRGSAKIKATMKKVTTTKVTTPESAEIAAVNRDLEGYSMIVNRLSIYNLALTISRPDIREHHELVQHSCPTPTPLLQKLAFQAASA